MWVAAKDTYSLAAIPDFPSVYHQSVLSDAGFEGERPACAFRAGVPSEPGFPWASHSSGHHNGWVQGREGSCWEYWGLALSPWP